ncbi:glycosyltransferase [Alphaproteobacteria bacterium]|nr:glycosyltransferase [Alphaproteobacteria bacterium]
MNISVVLYPSDMRFESRIQKISNVLLNNRIVDQVDIYGISQQSQEFHQTNKAISTTFLRIPAHPGGLFRNKMIRYLSYYFLVIKNTVGKKIKYIHAHSLSVLPLAVLMSKLTGGSVVYEPHELETETKGSFFLGKRINLIMKMLERYLISKTSGMVVVGNNIALWYEENYKIPRPRVIYNIPQWSTGVGKKNDYLRRKFELDEDVMIFIYQGIFCSGRSIDLLLETFAGLTSNKYVIVLLGFGSKEPDVIAAHLKNDNIYYHPPVEPERLIDVTSSADVGFALIEPISKSYEYSMPNKLFEYLHAGIPVIGSKMPESAALINNYEIGMIIDLNHEELLRVILSCERELLSRQKENIHRFKRDYSWDCQVAKLISLYESMDAVN